MLTQSSQWGAGVLLIALAVATYIDVRKHRIPNALALTAALAGLAAQWWVLGLDGVLAGAGGLAVGFCLFLPFYALGGMAAGDVKLMAAVGTFLGPASAAFAAGYSLMAGGVMGLAVLAARRGFPATMSRYAAIGKGLLYTGKISYEPPRPGEAAAARFPYAAAIALGTAIELWRYLPISSYLNG